MSVKTGSEATGRRMFAVALGFLVVVAGLGSLLRWSVIRPMPGFDYGNWLHAHSHTAFLGFVFNAFYACALTRFAPESEQPAYGRLFIVLQVAVLGMLATFPVQGYGQASIAFSTLHLAGVGVFAWRLWRRNLAAPGARLHLRLALACLALSGLGPLALGPLAALGLRDTPAYPLCIYFYLHLQYNGWFLFFIQALLLQPPAGREVSEREIRLAVSAGRWLGVGVILTLAQSTLWLGPPAWVRGVAALGGIVQLAGFARLLQALHDSAPTRGGTRLTRALWRLAMTSWGLKLGLQAMAAAPGLAALVNHRFVVIAFLHLVFLGVVTSALLACGFGAGWLRETCTARLATGIFFTAAAVSETVLVSAALGWAPPVSLPWLLFAPAAGMAGAACALFGAGVFSRPVPRLDLSL